MVPVINISTTAVTYGPGLDGNESPTGIRATAAQLAKMAFMCGAVLGYLGGAQQYVEEIIVKLVCDPRQRVGGPKREIFFLVHATIQGPEKKETRKVKVPLLENEAPYELFAREVHAAIVDTMKEIVRTARTDAEYWEKALQIRA